MSPGGYSPISWLVAVARNHSLDVLRARKPVSDDHRYGLRRRRCRTQPGTGRNRSRPSARASTAASANSSRDKADAVRGAYLDGFSYEELAARHDVPLNTMRTWLRRSLLKLRECLSA